MNTRKIELSDDERDLLLELKYYLDEDVLRKLTNAKIQNGYYKISLTRYDLENIVGNVSMLSNHEGDDDRSAYLNDLAEHMEVYL